MMAAECDGDGGEGGGSDGGGGAAVWVVACVLTQSALCERTRLTGDRSGGACTDDQSGTLRWCS